MANLDVDDVLGLKPGVMGVKVLIPFPMRWIIAWVIEKLGDLFTKLASRIAFL